MREEVCGDKSARWMFVWVRVRVVCVFCPAGGSLGLPRAQLTYLRKSRNTLDLFQTTVIRPLLDVLLLLLHFHDTGWYSQPTG